MYCVCLVLFLGGLIAAAVIGYGEVLSGLKEPLKDTMRQYDENSSSAEAQAAVQAWDDAQEGVRALWKLSYLS